MTQGQVPKTHPTAQSHLHDINPRETPHTPPKPASGPHEARQYPTAGGVGADTEEHGQPVRCLPVRCWRSDVTMVPARAAAASAGPAPQLGLAAEGEAFVSVQVLYLLPVRVFFALFPLQISSSQVTISSSLQAFEYTYTNDLLFHGRGQCGAAGWRPLHQAAHHPRAAPRKRRAQDHPPVTPLPLVPE